jgi:hypothetical protein
VLFACGASGAWVASSLRGPSAYWGRADGCLVVALAALKAWFDIHLRYLLPMAPPLRRA